MHEGLKTIYEGWVDTFEGELIEKTKEGENLGFSS
jgi:hypothetical protein